MMQSAKKPVRSYRDLLVWQKAMDLMVATYRLANLLPKTETYGLVSQMQRAATSIPANIAEGHGREHLGDYLRHLSIARGSLMELETHFFASQRLFSLPEDRIRDVFARSDEVSRMLVGLRDALKASRKDS